MDIIGFEGVAIAIGAYLSIIAIMGLIKYIIKDVFHRSK